MSRGIFDGQLAVSVKAGVVTIGGYGSDFKATLIGSSCTASVQAGTDYLSTISFAPNKGVNAIVALAVSYHSGRKDDYGRRVKGLLKLYWEGDKVVADLDQFVCPADRLGQVTNHNDLVVTTNGQVFGTCTQLSFSDQGNEKKKADFLKIGRLVADTDLLCRYLVGQATLEQLEAAASGDQRTVEQIQQHKLQTEFCDLQDKYLRLDDAFKKEILRGLDHALEMAGKESRMNDLLSEFSIMKNERDELKSQFDGRLGSRIKRWWRAQRASCGRGGRDAIVG